MKKRGNLNKEEYVHIDPKLEKVGLIFYFKPEFGKLTMDERSRSYRVIHKMIVKAI